MENGNLRRWMRLVETDALDPLAESFNNPQPYKWAIHSRRNWAADFTAGKLAYRVLFVHRKHEVEDDMWEVQFAQVATSWFKPTIYKTELTGSGNAVIIFSTVLACIREFLYEKHPHILFFTGRGDSRQSLYAKLSKTLALDHGYEFKTSPDPAVGTMLYVLVEK